MFEFFGTGSRFFGFAHKESDWDFFTLDCPGVRKFLLDNGFEIDHDATYDDPTVVSVYRKYESGTTHVDIQLVSNLEQKLLVQRILKNKFPRGLPGDKEAKKNIWKTAFAVLAEFKM